MDWSAAIDAYCERTTDAFWAEPVNALTNVAFLAAALWAMTLARRSDQADLGVVVLAGFTACVGIGSFLFHTVATRWAALADVVPIGLFIAVAVHLGLMRLAGFSAVPAAVATTAFLMLSPLLARITEPALGSSAPYGAAALAMPALAIAGWRRGCRGSGSILAAGAVFALSLALRMADGPSCALLPVGTHFGWHLLNGSVLALVMAGLATAARRAPDP